jgi:hypothetical protein
MFQYLASEKFSENCAESPTLCENKILMKQVSSLAVEYDRSGLKDINNVVEFVIRNAGLPYNDAMMSLYAADCLPQDKISLPSNLNCKMTQVNMQNKLSTDNTIVQRLKNNKASSIYMCSSILKYPKSRFVPSECGAHGVTVKGIRCEQGKYKYLIQNSWGNDHVAKNPAIETEKGHGAYWFDEKTFYDSTTQLITLDLDERR